MRAAGEPQGGRAGRVRLGHWEHQSFRPLPGSATAHVFVTCHYECRELAGRVVLAPILERGCGSHLALVSLGWVMVFSPPGRERGGRSLSSVAAGHCSAPGCRSVRPCVQIRGGGTQGSV